MPWLQPICYVRLKPKSWFKYCKMNSLSLLGLCLWIPTENELKSHPSVNANCTVDYCFVCKISRCNIMMDYMENQFLKNEQIHIIIYYYSFSVIISFLFTFLLYLFVYHHCFNVTVNFITFSFLYLIFYITDVYFVIFLIYYYFFLVSLISATLFL